MRFLFINHIQNAQQSLKSSRVRSFLTMIGIAIGVASVTIILSLSGGASKIINNQINSLGGNIIVIRPGNISDNSITSINQIQPNNNYTASTLKEPDIESISKITNIKSTAPIMKINVSAKVNSKAIKNASIIATTPQLADISNFKIDKGQFLDDAIIKDTAVIGAKLADNIFGSDSSIGKTITIHGRSLTVVGVLKDINNPINYNSVDFDNSVIINFEVGKEIAMGTVQIQQINVKANKISDLDKITKSINEILLKNHSGEKDFTILTGNKISQPTNQLFYTISGVMTAIATISLVVGGIGIMNIMLVTVAERTREIGIRKALGANNIDITLQFLIESLALSLGGGIIGYIVGYVIAFAVGTFIIFEPVFTWEIAGTAILLSAVMGTLFGLYPAIRAARKDPVESLRRYN